jgi:hypothetical protein
MPHVHTQPDGRHFSHTHPDGFPHVHAEPAEPKSYRDMLIHATAVIYAPAVGRLSGVAPGGDSTRLRPGDPRPS